MTALLFLLATPAQAEPLTQAQVQRMRPGDWNTYWVQLHTQATESLHQAQLSMLAAPETDPALLLSVSEHISAQLTQAQASADWPGEEGLREAVILDLQRIVRALDETIPRLLELASEPHPRDAHYQEAQAIWLSLERSDASAMQTIHEVQADFASRNHMVLTPAAPSPSPPDFGYAFPGEPSTLPVVMQANFSVRHYNELFEHLNGAVAAWDLASVALEEQRASVIPQQQVVVRGELEQLHAIPGWLGDSALRDHLEHHASELSQMLGGVMLEVAALQRRAALFSRARRQYNALISEMNRSTDALNQGTHLAQIRFQERWRWAEAQEYQEILQRWAIAQQDQGVQR